MTQEKRKISVMPSLRSDNPVLALYERAALESRLSTYDNGVQGANSVTLTRPMPESPTNNLEKESYRRGIKRSHDSDSSLAEHKTSLKGKLSLPGPSDFVSSWQNVRNNLREASQDGDPESQSLSRKPIYKRTWFVGSVCAILLALVLAAIVVLACWKSVIMPQTTLPGEIRSETSVQDLPQAAFLQHEVTTPAEQTTTFLPKEFVTPDATTPAEQTTRVLPREDSAATVTSDATSTDPTASSAVMGSLPVADAVTTASPVDSQRKDKWFLMFSLAGPLQRFTAGIGSP